MRFRASDVAAATGGTLVGDDVECDGASFDSRSLRPGQLFVPLVAERDGHDFVAAAITAGAAAYLRSRVVDGVVATAIDVDDTAVALMDLARWARSRSSAAHVVGVTGSVGKTSTKDLIAAAVGAGRRVAANERSFNNDQGLPVTILGASDDTEVLVVEMGMRGFGEIARLCDIARPDVGVVTAVGESHTERVGGLDGVARAKGELVEALPADGVAVLNADDERVAAMADRTDATVVTYGVRGDVRIDALTLDDLARPSFDVDTPWGRAPVRLGVSGAHMASNAAAAVAVAGSVGVDLDAAVAALADVRVSSMRMDVRRAPDGTVVVNDAYNANPTSTMAALDALAGVTAARRVAVLGGMAELDDPVDGHRRVAEHARSLGIEVVAVGTDLYGSAPADDPLGQVGPRGPDTAVLVKASRLHGLERLAAQLLGEEGVG